MSSSASTRPKTIADLPVGLDIHPMEARSVEELPMGDAWQFEPKWDGFRCLAFKAGDEVELRAKSGKPLGRYFPEVVQAVRELSPASFVLDGELAIARGDTLDFDALQLRLHPAESRIRKLSQETPARLILFDILLMPDGRDLRGGAVSERRASLEACWGSLDDRSLLRLSP